jgi:predicted nucleotidyltransferase
VAESLFTQREVDFLKILTDHEVEFIIIGLSAAALQGAPVVTQDIDIWFKDLNSPKLKKALKQAKVTYIPPFGLNPPMFAGESTDLIDIVLSVTGLDKFDDEVKDTFEIELTNFKIKVLPLEKIIKSKKKLGRPKDKLVIPVLEEVLKTLKSIEAL